MNSSEKMLEHIIEWAKNNESVRGIILVGSRAINKFDELSDFDINVFVNDLNKLTQNDSWISEINNVWTCSPDKYTWEDINVPTRLVIYEGGVKVDFSLFNTATAQKLANTKFYATGSSVLLDKDNQLESLTKTPTLVIQEKPTEEQFIHIINEFWFEAYHVAKYLHREDLWLVKFRDWSLQVYLLQMMEWYMLAKNNWDYDVKWTGKNIKEWLEPAIYEKLGNIFSHFDTKDSWKGFETRIKLFRELSVETAKLLNYKYPEKVDNKLTKFMLSLKPTT